MKISFDFDDTLENVECQKVAKDLIVQGYDVCILTTRYEDVKRYSFPCSHAELFRIAEELGIKEIKFTNFKWKCEVIDSHGIDIHVDDNYREEVIPINNQCKARAVSYSNINPKWEERLYYEISNIEGREDK